MFKKQRVAVLFGGVSSEHDISRMSASFVLDNLSTDKYDVFPIGLTKDGHWLYFKGDYSEIADGTWESNPGNVPVSLSPNANVRGFFVDNSGSYEVLKIDLIFPVLHGKNGEDGSIQGLLQLSSIPFVGCDMYSSAACMDKTISNIMFESFGINQADFVWLYDYEIRADMSAAIKRIEKALLTYPVFVKPACAGSSLGITKAGDRDELKKALLIAAKEDNKIVVEQAITGKEVECAVMGNEDRIETSVVGEIASNAEFYDFDAKYKSISSELYIPARLSDSIIEEIRATAKKTYMLMGCSGLARIDFFVDKNDNIYLNEINTMPGFTSISMYPKLFEYSGMEPQKLLDELIKLALNR